MACGTLFLNTPCVSSAFFTRSQPHTWCGWVLEPVSTHMSNNAENHHSHTCQEYRILILHSSSTPRAAHALAYGYSRFNMLIHTHAAWQRTTDQNYLSVPLLQWPPQTPISAHPDITPPTTFHQWRANMQPKRLSLGLCPIPPASFQLVRAGC